jgi:hypothetical protein
MNTNNLQPIFKEIVDGLLSQPKKERIEVEISFDAILPFFQKEQIWEEQYWDYFNIFELVDDICKQFNLTQDLFDVRFDGDDCDPETGETIHVLTEPINDPETKQNFSGFWLAFLPLLDYDKLLRKHRNLEYNID